jgi:hypothetical protein
MNNVANAIQNLGLINGLLSTSINQPDPVVGMGCTEYCGSDRSAYTIVEVSASGKRIGIVRANVKKTPGSQYGDETYDITPGTLEEGRTPWYFTKRKDGRYRPEGSSMKERAISIGTASEYRDPSF